MIKTVNFDFFKINMPKAAGLFDDLLETIYAMTGASRTLSLTRYHARLHSITRNARGRIIGEVAKIRMTGIPEKMKLNGDTDQIALDDDQGLGETAAFVYIPELQVLVYQKNRDSVSASKFSEYLSLIGEVEDDIDFDLILETEALRRLAKLDIVRRFELQVAGPSNAAVFKDLGLTPEALVQLKNSSPTMKTSFIFSMGNQKQGSLLTRDVRVLCKQISARIFTNQENEEKIKLLITGKEKANADTEVIDLFNDRMIESIEIDIGDNRVISHDFLTQAAQEAWTNRKNELLEMFQEE